MSGKRSTLKARYLQIVAEVDGTPVPPRRAPRIVTVGEARLIVDDLFDENDPETARAEIAGLLARSLSGEAMYHHLVRTHARNLPEKRKGSKPRTNITPAIRDAIVRADRDLQRAGKSVKKDRNAELAKRFGIPVDTIRKVTPQLGRGRPRKTQDKP